ncbi:hypothetical protein [Sphingomonas sp.]|uniref:hypothetical protein n=1 Tax=Sphingomonas sp. TaxID=28214 RepID=UPI003B3B1C1D
MIALLLAAAAAITAANPDCARMQPAAGFEGWGRAGGTALAVDRAAALKLEPAGNVRFDPPLTRKPKPNSYGGYFPLTVAKAGRYRIALSDRAWVDAVNHGKRLKSTAHMHGPACSGIAKIVAFDLPAGRSWLQISENGTSAISAMVSSH